MLEILIDLRRTPKHARFKWLIRLPAALFEESIRLASSLFEESLLTLPPLLLRGLRAVENLLSFFLISGSLPEQKTTKKTSKTTADVVFPD